MMIGSILEVMGEEKNAMQTKQAHDEREHMSQQLAAVQRQLDKLTSMLDDQAPRR